ncbi:14528_t:CDS:2, partial [Acaulospora colombiana]
EEWSPELVTNFLRLNKKLFLNEKTIQIIETLDYSGENFLQSTEEELERRNIPHGAAKRILNELREQAKKGTTNSSKPSKYVAVKGEGGTSDTSSLPEDEAFEERKKPHTNTPKPIIVKSNKKRLSSAEAALPNMDDIETLREKFRRIYESRKENEGITFKKIVDEEIEIGYISSFTISKFYNGESALRVGQNEIAVRDWVGRYEKKIKRKIARN